MSVRQESYDNPLAGIKSVQEHISGNVRLSEGDWMLEAGCGSSSRLVFPQGLKKAGIDISQKQLDRNEGIDLKMCGDLQEYPLEKNKFSMCVCWDVLEHLEQPEKAVMNMVQSLKQGGCVILAMPNLFSLKGIVTKLTPHWFHVWFYRTILGVKDAGINDTPPFRTYMDKIISPENLVNLLEREGCRVEKLIFRDVLTNRLKKDKYPVWLVYVFLGSLVYILTAGKFGGSHRSDYIVVATKL